MSDDLNLPPTPGADEGSARARRVCEFCGCTLTALGDVLTFSPKARTYRNHDEVLEKLTAQLTTAETNLRVVTAERDAALVKKVEPSVRDLLR